MRRPSAGRNCPDLAAIMVRQLGQGRVAQDLVRVRGEICRLHRDFRQAVRRLRRLISVRGWGGEFQSRVSPRPGAQPRPPPRPPRQWASGPAALAGPGRRPYPCRGWQTVNCRLRNAGRCRRTAEAQCSRHRNQASRQPFLRRIETVALFTLSDAGGPPSSRCRLQVAQFEPNQDIVREGDRPTRSFTLLSGIACTYQVDAGRQAAGDDLPRPGRCARFPEPVSGGPRHQHRHGQRLQARLRFA